MGVRWGELLGSPLGATAAQALCILQGKLHRTYSGAVESMFGRWGFHTCVWVQHVSLVLYAGVVAPCAARPAVPTLHGSNAMPLLSPLTTACSAAC